MNLGKFISRFPRSLGVIPLLDIEANADAAGEWKVTGPDPQFDLASIGVIPLPAGSYAMRAIGGGALAQLHEASFYIDTGAGFSEDERLPIRFFEETDGGFTAYCRFDKPVIRIRFDPADGSRPTFSLLRLEFAPNSAHEQAARLQRESDGRIRLLMNLVRLLPETEGAGGAGRVCKAYLTHLPDFVSLRVAVAPYHAHLAPRYPKAEFVVVTADDTAQMSEHLDWCDCYFDPLNALRPTYIPKHVPVLGCVLDLQHMHHPTFFSETENTMRLREYGYVFDRADVLVAISEFEKRNFQIFYGVDSIRVMHLSGFMAEDAGLTREDVATARAEKSIERRYLIYPAVPWIHKNHEILLQAIAVLRHRGLDVPIMLTNAGAKKERVERLMSWAQHLGVADLVQIEAFLPESTLLHYFIHSVGLVFPSLYEGFGIPIVDAMKLGVPVLTGTSSAITEIGGDACAYFQNERNALAVANDIERFWLDADLRRELVEKGYARAENFSSRKMAEQLTAAIDTLVDRKKNGADANVPASRRERRPAVIERLAVFALYLEPLEPEQAAALRDIDDLDLHHARLFGAQAQVTVGVDISLLQDEAFRALFANARRTIVLDSSKSRALELATQDFSHRYNDAHYQLVTTLPQKTSDYRADVVDAILMVLDLNPSATYAEIDFDAVNVTLDPAPTEIDGVLEYEKRRKTGFVVTDTVIRRSGPLSDLYNGDIAYLSAFCTQGTRLRFPGRASIADDSRADGRRQ
ncbi:glycosyltransferase family 4 protein [Methylosinus sp. H3A]|uniref:glycosyltransferase family 4 protein n=1 Tax=Methylosinus sp. H3A TaxID=2785786 RepID=UPI0018C31AF7|nr:glycosyltransferase family 1 protein [Methylosinus sp. H3A]MBG0811877.1 glycosyltransferase family 4 protein [Methylosinus sp. H3A]